MDYIVKEVPGLFKIIRLKEFRRTENVEFDIMVKSAIPQIDGIDRVMHRGPAVSPGPVEGVERPWYMHYHQEDNLMVMAGERNVELYSVDHGKVEKFVVTPDYISHNGEVVLDGPGLLVWPTHVFHRIISGPKGSASLNLATRDPEIDMKYNFDIFELNIETGEYKVVREGYKDQRPID